MSDPVFRAHWLGVVDASRIPNPDSAFSVPKTSCDDPSHRSCGDCLRAVWYHDRIAASSDRRCGLCRAMHLTICMRRRPDATAKEFAEFDAWVRENLDYLCRALDARHLVSFINNYATHGSGPERAAAATAAWMNLAEKVSTSAPPRTAVLPKVEGWPVSDGRFVRERTFAHPASNFTMYNWNGGDAIGKSLDVVVSAMSESPVVLRLTMAVLAWAVLYDCTNPGLMRRFSKEKSWIDKVLTLASGLRTRETSAGSTKPP
jgi:hypothetical protein